MITIGQILNNTYKITEQLGSGGGGIVFKAYHLRLEKYVAIKLIKEKVRGKINERAEADILKGLKHEGLPQVYDFVNDGDDIYTVMEFIDGRSLYEIIKEKKTISYIQTIEWAKQLCSATAYLHTRKPPIIHSDIKPQNIMITNDGQVCLIDFNISSVFDDVVYTIGTSDGYSPPEQYELLRQSRTKNTFASDDDKTEILSKGFSDDRTELLSDRPDNAKADCLTIDEKSDVYSIGAVMYSMLSGINPGNSMGNIRQIDKIDEKIPESLAFIINKAMSKNKSDRFSDASEMLKAINRINKLDKRYRNAEIRTMLGIIFCLIIFTGSAVASIAGFRLIKTETDEKYSGLIAQLGEMNRTGDYTDFEEIFEAVSLEFPEKKEPYYYYIFKLYSEKDYDNALKYFDEYIADDLLLLNDDIRAKACYIEADMLYDSERYSEANAYYEQALEANYSTSDIYRDYAISLARAGEIEKAEKVVELAMDRGISEGEIYLVNGEIHYAKKEYHKAVTAFKKAIELVSDDALKRNAYIICSRSYKQQYTLGEKALVKENIELLEKGLLSLPQSMLLQLKEQLSQAYIDYAEADGNKEYYAKALKLIYEMELAGWKTYNLEMNIAVLSDKLGDTVTAMQRLKSMLDVPEYSADYYIIYIRLAYCEADIQSKSDVDQRDYTAFDEYYHAALKEYQDNNISDAEMDLLTQLREKLSELDWL